jgi:acetyl-CoA acetyltransferase
LGLATAAIQNESAKHVVSLMVLQQGDVRFGRLGAESEINAIKSFTKPAGMVGPGYAMSVLIRRHMHLYGSTRDAFFEIVQSQRENAIPRATALRRKPLSREEYFASPMLADPLCRLDFTLETDGAVAVITTTTERAKDCKHKPIYIHAVEHGGAREWGRAFSWFGMPEPNFASAGHKAVADRMWERTDLRAKDMDVALIYDHISPMVLMQLEEYGFCEKGEGNDYVLSGKLRYSNRGQPGVIPVNTHGGQLSEGYVIGMTHIREGVEQLRGEAVNQVEGAEFALVTGGPAPIPTSGLVLRN